MARRRTTSFVRKAATAMAMAMAASSSSSSSSFYSPSSSSSFMTAEAFAMVPPPFASSSPAAAGTWIRLGSVGRSICPTSRSRLHSEATSSSSSSLSKNTDDNSDDEEEDDDDDDDEWEYVEYESLTESDFYNSEWKVGTVWGDKPDVIKETWARLITDDDGTNIAIWGDGSKGKWNLDVASQFLSISKETFGGWLGKRIWAGVVEDYYYLQGTVRGWSPISPASVLGQWQAKRLGVDPDEMGVAPWFMPRSNSSDDDDDDDDGNDQQEE